MQGRKRSTEPSEELLKEQEILWSMGKRVRAIRQARRLSLEKAAEKAHISTQYLSQIERGLQYPGAVKLFYLSEAFGVSADYLLSGKVENERVRLAAEYIASLDPVAQEMLAQTILHLQEIIGLKNDKASYYTELDKRLIDHIL